MIWIPILGGLAIVYVALCLVFYFGQDFFFFRPEKLPDWFSYEYPYPFEEKNFDMEDGGSVNCLHFKVPNARGVVFYIKGNSRSIKGWGKFARDFIGKGFDFFIMDYRGFGKSRGKRTEAILYDDLQQVYRWLAGEYGEEQITLYGRSLGSGLAARIASWNRPRMLILDSPYFSFLAHIKLYGFFLPLRWLLRYQIRTDLFFKKISCPVFIIHGKKDRLIPFFNSEKLKKAWPDKVVLLPIERAGHNNLPKFSEYHDLLYEVLNEPEGVLEMPTQPKI